MRADPRAIGWRDDQTYGMDVVRRFLEKHNLKAVVCGPRSRDDVQTIKLRGAFVLQGYSALKSARGHPQHFTVFSTPRYFQ